MTEYKYNAFISYRHAEKDSRVAKELQQQLERFVIPEPIRQRYGIRKIERIFKDQEELELTDDLSEQLDENLRSSEYLIVICSPAYLQSKWCLQEVEHFLSYRDHDHVICVLADGEPPAVFPPVLLSQPKEVSINGQKRIVEESVEPLAADYRQDFRQARKIELPRIAARLIGCSYDELVMRQERYRRRKLAAILTGVIVAAVLAISYLLWSNAMINRNYQRSLINESKVLSANAVSAMEQMDRYSALNSALQALPSADQDRPIIDEALYAASLASYAYQPPYGFLETWRVDQAADVIDHFVSRDAKWLVCLNSEGTVTVYSLAEREMRAQFPLKAGSLPDHIEEGSSGQLVCYFDGAVHAYDFINASELWALPLKYQWLGTAHLSPDHKYIAAADTLAIQVMTVKGEPFLSLPLPAELDGYITDFTWSQDGQYLAAIIRSEGRYQIGCYEFETSRFHLHEEKWLHIDGIYYDSQNVLYVVADDSEKSSAFYDNSTYLITADYFLTAYRDQSVRYSATLPAASLNGSCQLAEQDGHVLLVTLGNQLMLIDQNGRKAFGQQTPAEISGILDYDQTAVSLALYDGQQLMVSLADGSSISSQQFSRNCQQAEMLENGSCLSVCDGNLQIYESVYDDSLEYFAEPLNGEGDDYFTDETTLAIPAGRTVSLYDRQSRQALGIIELDRKDGYHYLDCANGQLRILKIDADSAAMSVLFYELRSGQLVREKDLGIREFHVANGYLSSPMSDSDAYYLDSIYRGCSPLVLQSGVLYLHQQDDPCRLVIYDMNSDQLTELTIRVPDNGVLLDSTILSVPSCLAVSADGKWLFTAVKDVRSGAVSGIIVDLSSGECHGEVEAGFDDKQFVWKEELLIMREHALEALAADGTVRYQISLTSHRPLTFDLHDGLLSCLYPDGRLQVYRQGELLKTVSLPFADGSVISAQMIRFQYHEDRLYLLWRDKLAAVDLASEGTTPLFTVGKGALGCLPDRSEILTYALTPASLRQYYPAVYHLYDAQQLMERAGKQLGGYLR
jgi:WD40 repeat protein